MPIDHHHPPAIGRIDRGTYGGQFVSGQRTEVVAPIGVAGASSLFDFKLSDASEGLQGKVAIADGVVYGPNDDGIYPDGMPANGTYELNVNNGDEIWIQVVFDEETDDHVSGENITDVSLASGPVTPDDNYLTTYFTIGHVEVDYSATRARVIPTNEICGDLFIWLPPNKETGVTNDLALVVDKDTHNRVWKKVCGS